MCAHHLMMGKQKCDWLKTRFSQSLPHSRSNKIMYNEYYGLNCRDFRNDLYLEE